MAFLEVVGEFFGFSNAKGWTLEALDPGFESGKFEGQFITENMEENIGSTLGETTTVNKDKPDFKWLHGEAEIFTFTTRLWASDSLKNINKTLHTLKNLARRNDELRRAPRCVFTAGSEISFNCFVRGIKTKYDELRSDGSLRGAIIDLTLQKIESDIKTDNAATSLASQLKFAGGLIAGAVGLVATGKKLIDIPGGSLHTIDRTVEAKQGNTFESIAKKEYGNALLGDVLRRAQPEKANFKPGDKIILVEPSEIRQIAVTQQSIPLKSTQANTELREVFLSRLNRKTKIVL